MSQPAATGHSFRGQTSIDKFTDWLVEFFAKPCAVFYTQHTLKQGVNGIYLGSTLPDNLKLNNWEQGRVFNQEFELRWSIADELVMLFLLTEGEDTPVTCTELCKWIPLEPEYEVESTQHILVGTCYRHDKPKEWFFAEAGVPQAFRYPFGKGVTPQQGVRTFLYGKHYRRGGRTILTRFTHFKPEQRKGRKVKNDIT